MTCPLAVASDEGWEAEVGATAVADGASEGGVVVAGGTVGGGVGGVGGGVLSEARTVEAAAAWKVVPILA